MRLPTYERTLKTYRLTDEALTPRAPSVPLTRTAFAAAHVVSNPLAERDQWVGRPAVDWENTLKFRHWLGDMFDPALIGYWGSSDVADASDAVLEIINANPAKVDRIKISFLDQAHEEAFRARLPDDDAFAFARY